MPVLLAVGVYAAIFGPGIVKSVLVTGYVLGAVSPGLLYDVQVHYSTWAAFTISLALLCGASELAGRHAREYPLPALMARVSERGMGIAVPAGCALAVVAALYRDDFVGGRTAFIGIEALAAAIWFALLCPGECSLVLGRAPGHAHAARTRRTAVVSMLGFAAGTPAAAQLILEWVLTHGPAGVAYRLAAMYQDGYADTGAGASAIFPAFGSLRSALLLLARYAANAFAEEAVFAAIVLTLARYGAKRWAIIAVATVLRIFMHLYYGPPGLGMGIFSGLNAWALLRWRRLAPLIACHFLYDAVLWVGVRKGWLSTDPWTQYIQLVFVGVGGAALFWLFDALVRRARPVPTAQVGP